MLDERHLIYFLHEARHFPPVVVEDRPSVHESTSRSVPGDSARSLYADAADAPQKQHSGCPSIRACRARTTLHDDGPTSILGREQATEHVKDTEPSERHGTAPYRSHSLTSLACRRHVNGQLIELLLRSCGSRAHRSRAEPFSVTKPGRVSSHAVDVNGDQDPDTNTGPFDRGLAERSCTTLQTRPRN